MSEIKRVTFDLIKSENLQDHATIEITKAELYDQKGYVKQDGLLDPRLGVDSYDKLCMTCDLKGGSCLGHEGYIDLTIPVLVPGLRNYFREFLKGVCLNCKTYNLSKTCKTCESSLKYKFLAPYIVINLNTGKMVEMRTLYQLFGAIPFEQYVKYFKRQDLKPQDFFMTKLIVPGIPLRPNPRVNNVIMINDLTKKLQTIVTLNLKLKKYSKTEALDLMANEIYNLLCYQIFTYIDNKISSLPASTVKGGKVVKSLLEKIESKQGILRSNLRGKRTNYSARGVISSDSTLKINEIGIPLSLAKNLTKPVYITKYNLDQVKSWFTSDESVSKVVYYDSKQQSGEFYKLKVTESNKELILSNLSIGDVVHRSLRTGDRIAFNRAPSIHRYSVMGHKCVIYDDSNQHQYTFKMNPSICLPYNADFDGDQMNIHIPQTLGAQIDTRLYMAVEKNYRDSKNGYPIVNISKELLLAAHFLTKNNPKFTRAQAINLLGTSIEELPFKTEYDSRQLISACLIEGFNFKDQDIVVENGHLISGIFNKSNFSRSSKFLQSLIVYAGDQFIEIYEKLSYLFRKYYSYISVSLSLKDYQLQDKIKEKLDDLKEHYATMINQEPSKIYSFSKEYQLKAYSLLQQYYVNLNAQKEDNLALAMSLAGSSGTLTNLIQISNFIGPRLISGFTPHEYFKGLYPTFTGPSLETQLFKQGLIWNSYYKGLTYLDFINDCITARDATVTNQLKITSIGYFSRRVICAVADLYIDSNNHIVDNKNRIIQYKFGGSGINLEDYKPNVIEPHFKNKIKMGEFTCEDPKTISRANLEKYLLSKGYDETYGKIILANSDLESYSERQCDKMCHYLTIPCGTPIGIAAGHSLTEPSTQLTLSAKHKLSGGQTTFERLESLIDRSLVVPRIMISCAKPEEMKRIVDLLIPFKLKDLYKVETHLETFSLKFLNLDQKHKAFFENVLGDMYDKETYSFVKEGSDWVLYFKDLSLKKFYEVKDFLKNLIVKGEPAIKSYLLLDQTNLIVEGSKNTIALYKKLKSMQKELQPAKLKYMDPIYLNQIEGIEKARKLLYNELVLFITQGVVIDPRYMSLFCDLVTYEGALDSISRAGVIKTKSPLTRCSFEAAKSLIYSLALNKETDNLKSSLASIILGKPLQIGSNYYKIQF